jgi:hypothetical protein
MTNADVLNELMERAANSARNGDKDVKAGAIDAHMLALQQQAVRVHNDARRAKRLVEHWRALVQPDEAQPRHQWPYEDAPIEARQIADALLERAILQALAITDQPSKDRVTLSGVVSAIAKPHMRKKLSSEDWLRTLGYRDLVIAHETKRNANALDWLLGIFPKDWTAPGHLGDLKFFAIRSRLEKFRNGYLVHSLDTPPADTELPTFDEVIWFIDEVYTLTRDLQRLLTGDVLLGDAQFVRNEAQKFWSHLLQSP